MIISIMLGWPCFGSTPPQLALVQPHLLTLAQERPDDNLRVIVQKRVADTSPEALIARLGGEVLKDLHIINAFAANIPARAIHQLQYAEGIRWISLDGPIVPVDGVIADEIEQSFSTFLPYFIAANIETEYSTQVQAAKKGNGGGGNGGGDTSCPACTPNTYSQTINADGAWDLGLDGSGIGVAVIDSGIKSDADFENPDGTSRIAKRLSFNPLSTSNVDVYGHGTHVAGIIGGNGADSNGLYAGVAPMVNLISLKISDEVGMAYESDTVDAMQWVLDNKDDYNIRVVNLSINSTVEQSYHTSPLNAAAEILWFNNMVVVASAGNWQQGSNFNPIKAAPANDPFLITVGASDEWGTSTRNDDYVAIYSAYGTTTDGFRKPDIIAPGSGIVSVLSRTSDWESLHPERLVHNDEYFRISGTSMAAPMVTGAVALLLQSEPELTPDQVKYRLLNKSMSIGNGPQHTYPYLNIDRAITEYTSESANTNIEMSQLLWTGEDPSTWQSVNWGSVNWGNVNWGSVNWGSVNWGSVHMAD